MQRVRIIDVLSMEDTELKTYIIYDDIKVEYVFDVAAFVQSSYQCVTLGFGGEL